MSIIYVQFSDEAQSSVISWFPCAQDEGAFANLGTLQADDPRYAAFYNSFPDDAQIGMPNPLSG